MAPPAAGHEIPVPVGTRIRVPHGRSNPTCGARLDVSVRLIAGPRYGAAALVQIVERQQRGGEFGTAPGHVEPGARAMPAGDRDRHRLGRDAIAALQRVAGIGIDADACNRAAPDAGHGKVRRHRADALRDAADERVADLVTGTGGPGMRRGAFGAAVQQGGELGGHRRGSVAGGSGHVGVMRRAVDRPLHADPLAASEGAADGQQSCFRAVGRLQ